MNTLIFYISMFIYFPVNNMMMPPVANQYYQNITLYENVQKEIDNSKKGDSAFSSALSVLTEFYDTGEVADDEAVQNLQETFAANSVESYGDKDISEPKSKKLDEFKPNLSLVNEIVFLQKIDTFTKVTTNVLFILFGFFVCITFTSKQKKQVGNRLYIKADTPQEVYSYRKRNEKNKIKYIKEIREESFVEKKVVKKDKGDQNEVLDICTNIDSLGFKSEKVIEDVDLSIGEINLDNEN
ncbi:MAG: hypothetical protein ACK5LV_07000 [Lachnospirales bacterium]